MTDTIEPVHVAVAVIRNDQGQVLLSLRADDVHQGGLWEFPGGKRESDESIDATLRRECLEELGIDIKRSRPLIRIPHDYGDTQVLLEVSLVEDYAGTPESKEGQEIEWVAIDKLSQREMPEANRSIVNALVLPDEMLITPDIETSEEDFLQQLEHSLQAGIKLVQFRQTQLADEAFINLARDVLALSREHGASVILNHSPEMYAHCVPEGLHLNSQRLMALCGRPVSMNTLLSASCHNLDEVQQANSMGVDFIVIAPVASTLTHPEADVLGWSGFQDLADAAAMPAYALGGMQAEDKAHAFASGGQGIAAIRSLWKSEE